jgi:hypothetical protein
MLTGHALAQFKFMEAVTAGSLITPGYGGRVYYLTNNGFIVYLCHYSTLDQFDND